MVIHHLASLRHKVLQYTTVPKKVKGRHQGSLQLPVTDRFACDTAALAIKKKRGEKKSRLSVLCCLKNKTKKNNQPTLQLPITIEQSVSPD